MRAAGVLMAVAFAWVAAGCGRQPEPLAPPATPRLEAPLEIRAATFNIRYENKEDRGQRAWEQRVTHAIRLIRRMRPDVLGVQEALHGPAADLWASLPEYGFHGVGRRDGWREGEYAAIFYDKRRFQPDVTDSGTFWLSETPGVPGSRTWGNEIPRSAAWLRLVDRATGRGFYVFNTHWDHRSQPSREHAALLIAERIDQRRRPDEPVILMGDFNAVEENPAVAYLRGLEAEVAGRQRKWETGLVETFLARHPRERNRRTLHLWSGRRDGPLKIDHILVSPDARVLEAAVEDDPPPLVSDHFPVTARVIFPGE